ncbi:MAG: 2-(1,2-epoxy-1,2-dihydrophenyl)acetyl-CoA isomerase [Saprospiraceae bacterium]|nr:2-(1,2-epoxy-1,2-dihydrophenyl)acetyl-CoA isomerase [Saprospiraceae bacterium]
MSTALLFEKIGHVGKITLNRPNSYNSVNKELAYAFLAAMKTCAEDDDIRAIVITGEGKAFCAGQDLKEVTDPNSGLELEQIVSQHYNPMALSVYNMPKPVIAAVNGVAAGAGANLALLCDIVVAKSSASFIQAFSKIGLIPDTGGTYTMQRLVGYNKAMALAMTGDKVSATEAEKMGMIYKCVEDEAFDEFVDKLAQKMSKMPTKGLALTKKAFQEGLNNSFEEQLAREAHYQIIAGNTHDYNEGVTAFVEKRKPEFKGQ